MINLLLNGAEAKGPVISKDNSVHGASGGGIAPVGTVSCSLTASEDRQGPYDSQYSLIDEFPRGQ